MSATVWWKVATIRTPRPMSAGCEGVRWRQCGRHEDEQTMLVVMMTMMMIMMMIMMVMMMVMMVMVVVVMAGGCGR